MFQIANLSKYSLGKNRTHEGGNVIPVHTVNNSAITPFDKVHGRTYEHQPFNLIKGGIKF